MPRPEPTSLDAQAMLDPTPSRLDAKRYRQVRRFFLYTTLRILWWDIILNRPLLCRLRTTPVLRWQKWAQAYRTMAVEMGGVLIKLGQFLSTRVDLLPLEVTEELAKLQDQVPAAPFDDVVSQIEASFKRPLSQIFGSVSPQVLGAASLAQVHRAMLPSGEAVVVKVLRPGIADIVEADLVAIAQAIRRLKHYKPIRTRVDLEALIAEFTTGTRNELNLQQEAHNIERFAACYRNDARVYPLRVFWEQTSSNILTMADVSYIRLDAIETMTAVGIDPAEVAKTVFSLYLEQFFVHHFVHADPHAGNVFIKPLPHPAETYRTDFGPTDDVPFWPDRPFQIVFVDFGMVTEIPPTLQAAFREYAIGIGTRDARRIVRSYVMGNSLMPGADLARIEELTQDTLDHFWGTLLGQFNKVNLVAYNQLFFHEYRDVFQHSPFQLRVEMLYVFRAMGILSGIIASLDAQFEPLSVMAPFVQQLMQQNGALPWGYVLQEGGSTIQLLSRLPARLDEVLTQSLRGKLVVQNALSPSTQKTLKHMQQTVHRQTWVITAALLFMAGTIWRVGDLIVAAVAPPGPQGSNVPLWLMGLAALSFLWGILRKT